MDNMWTNLHIKLFCCGFLFENLDKFGYSFKAASLTAIILFQRLMYKM